MKDAPAAVIAYAFLSIAAAVGQGDDVSQWKSFSNRAGWTIKHPRNWHVSSCRSCPDATDPSVFVALEDPKIDALIMIEHLIDKPADKSVEQWLNDISRGQNVNPRVSEEWISLNGARALKVINRNRDLTESENLYLLSGSKTFTIHADRITSSYQLEQRILSTFKFTN